MNEMFESFLDAVGLPVAIIDLKGAVLALSRWQQLCVEFHRANKGTLARCIEGDMDIYKQVESGKQFSMYKCRNGLIGCCSPIVVEGFHIANLFIGQFFVQKPVDAFFENMMIEFGFEREAYLQAVAEAPIVSEDKLEPIMKMLVEWANHIADKSIAETRTKKALASVEDEVHKRTAELRRAQNELKEREALIQSEKMAQLGNMLGAIIHQWKQPLSPISLEA